MKNQRDAGEGTPETGAMFATRDRLLWQIAMVRTALAEVDAALERAGPERRPWLLAQRARSRQYLGDLQAILDRYQASRADPEAEEGGAGDLSIQRVSLSFH